MAHTFYSKSADMIKMAAVYVGIHPKEASDNGPDCITEVPWKGNAYQQVSDIVYPV